MKKNKHISLLILFILINIYIPAQYAAAQGIWREKIKEKMKENRNKRIEQRREKRKNQTPTVKSKLRGQDYDYSLKHDGLQRTYLIHVPHSYNISTDPTALILAFHGGMGDKEYMANDEYYNLISKSDKEGFIVVFPNGASKFVSGKFATWNAGNCCAYARDKNIDDIGFIQKLVEELKTKFNIDSEKIYATGMSNGGMLSHRIACDLTDTFAAIASVAGTDNYDSCNPSAPISIMHIHAKDDAHVLFNGGAGDDAFKDKSKVTEFTSVEETISRWVKRNHCSSEPKRVLKKEGAYCDLYTGCDDNVEVKLCVTETGAHSWPGGNKPPRKKAASPSNAISAVDEMWDFFLSLSMQ